MSSLSPIRDSEKSETFHPACLLLEDWHSREAKTDDLLLLILPPFPFHIFGRSCVACYCPVINGLSPALFKSCWLLFLFLQELWNHPQGHLLHMKFFECWSIALSATKERKESKDRVGWRVQHDLADKSVSYKWTGALIQWRADLKYSLFLGFPIADCFADSMSVCLSLIV